MRMCIHDKRNYRQLTFTFTCMNNERYFHNQLTNCFIISMHYSWWLFHKINQKSFKQDIGHKLERSHDSWIQCRKTQFIFRLSMAKHLKSHRSSFNRQTVIFIAKGNSSSYNNLPVLLGKKSLSLSTFTTFIQKQKMVGLPKVTFGLPNASFSQISFYKLLN